MPAEEEERVGQRENLEYRKAALFAVVAAILFACSAPLSKRLLDGIPPVLMAGLLYLGAGIGAGLILVSGGVRGRGNPALAFERKDLRFLAGMVLLDVAAPVLLLTGLVRTTAANASLLMNFEIVATALVASLFFRERVSARLWLAIALVTVASCLLTFERGDGFRFSIGSVYVLLATACWGLENNCTRMLANRNPIAIVAIKGVGSGSCSLAIGLSLGQRASGWIAVLLALAVGFFTYGLSIACYIRAQRTLGAAKTSAYYAAAPFLGTLVSCLLLQERPGAAFYVALPLMGLGAYVATIDPPKITRSAD